MRALFPKPLLTSDLYSVLRQNVKTVGWGLSITGSSLCDQLAGGSFFIDRKPLTISPCVFIKSGLLNPSEHIFFFAHLKLLKNHVKQRLLFTQNKQKLLRCRKLVLLGRRRHAKNTNVFGHSKCRTPGGPTFGEALKLGSASKPKNFPHLPLGELPHDKLGTM